MAARPWCYKVASNYTMKFLRVSFWIILKNRNCYDYFLGVASSPIFTVLGFVFHDTIFILRRHYRNILKLGVWNFHLLGPGNNECEPKYNRFLTLRVVYSSCRIGSSRKCIISSISSGLIVFHCVSCMLVDIFVQLIGYSVKVTLGWFGIIL